MKALEYLDYCNYFASKCKFCHGEKRIQDDNIWKSCSCQLKATAKWRFEQIEITPAELKYKTWSDFTGEIKSMKNGRLETVGRLDESAFVQAWQKAVGFCFRKADPKSIKDRKNNLIIHHRPSRSENLVIVGGPRSGRTLLASLVFKEVVFASMLHDPKLDFKWIKVSDLLHGSRWYGEKDIDDSLTDELSEVKFLALDGVDVVHQGVRKLGGTHTIPADHTTLSRVFSSRLSYHSTIITCSDEFWDLIIQRPQVVAKSWGEDFVTLLTTGKTEVIQLQKKVAEIG